MKPLYALLLTAGAAWAKPAFDIQPTLDCLEAAGHEGDREACVGVTAGVCMEADYSTAGMSFCLYEEQAWWDAELNAAYKEARAAAKVADAELPEPLNVQEASLRDMQQAWIAFRDARCAWEAAQWQGGTGQGPAFAGCLMQETGRQVTTLRIMGLGQ